MSMSNFEQETTYLALRGTLNQLGLNRWLYSRIVYSIADVYMA